MRTKGFFGKELAVAVGLAMVLAVAGTALGASAKKVAVFPFTMNSPQDLGFLQNGLFSMLSSRLADPGKVEVLDRDTVDAALARAQGSELAKGALTEDKARMIGAEMGVDFVLFGSLTHFGESVSLDARMVDVAGQKETLAFFEQSNAMGDVIPLVNTFAGDVNQKVFNRVIDNKLYVPPAPEGPQAPGGLMVAGAYGGGGGLQNLATKGFQTHLKYNGIITAMAAGDLKNDGVIRVVAATDSTLMIYRFQGNMLALEETLEYSTTNRIVGLDVADIDRNGVPEIFVTSITIHRDGLMSFVVEYNGKAFVTKLEDENYYYRVTDNEEGGKRLMAQATGNSPFNGRIYTMAPDGEGYREENRLRMPRNVSVLSMDKGKTVKDGNSQYAMINIFGRLILADEKGSKEWESTEKYGLTGNFWLMPKNDTDASYRERVYLHPRVVFYDVDGDGLNELIAVKNNEFGGGALGRYKRFKDGHIEMLRWNGVAMAPVFRTGDMQGWISDYAIVDIDGDGEKELLVSAVTLTKMAILSKDKASNIISYKLR